MAHTMEYDGNGNPKSVTTTNSTVTTSEYVEIGRMRTNGFENAAGLLYNYTNGIPAALKQNGNLYYYITNLQGDVIRLVDANGNTAALYKYDPYGNPIHASGSLATINPLRYRGYYYDSETGLYYVSSRYYDPEIGRFINADEVDLLGKNGDFASFNLFAYCGNNPITRKDSGGYVWETIFDVLSLGASIMEVAFNPEDPFAWLGLAGDTVDLFPFVTGVGETIRTLKTVSKVADGTDEVIDTYRNLRKFTKGSDLEVHHIVEKRFKKRSEISLDNTDDRLSVVLSKTNHKDYTNAWRNALPYEVTIQKNKYFKQK